MCGGETKYGGKTPSGVADHCRSCARKARALQNNAVGSLGLPAVFERHINAQAENGCWEWIASLYPNGYGHIRKTLNGRSMNYSHIFAYTFLKGPIPKGMVLHHTCFTPSCCNPDHLVPMTYRDHKRLHMALKADVAPRRKSS